jgi:beta-phosphoglucomutase-like phosphatase (HAD superfamily)
MRWRDAKRGERLVEMKIDASELKGEEKDIIKALADFLKEKTGADVTTESEKVTVKGEGVAVSKKYLRVLVKKFLHKHELKDYFRVIGDAEDTLQVKERKLYEEE